MRDEDASDRCQEIRLVLPDDSMQPNFPHQQLSKQGHDSGLAHCGELNMLYFELAKQIQRHLLGATGDENLVPARLEQPHGEPKEVDVCGMRDVDQHLHFAAGLRMGDDYRSTGDANFLSRGAFGVSVTLMTTPHFACELRAYVATPTSAQPFGLLLQGASSPAYSAGRTSGTPPFC